MLFFDPTAPVGFKRAEARGGCKLGVCGFSHDTEIPFFLCAKGEKKKVLF